VSSNRRFSAANSPSSSASAAGTWLGLTGLDIGAADAIHARLADLKIASSRLGEAIDALSALPRASSSGDVDAVLQALSEPQGESR
ncbi:enoyl-CoA hydratase/isomerase family protein, partial [Rhizobium leguminosarum]|uniref:enoyl-CoA hydratase/isomerase family protein n=1 Tax=Rhizobium leguminosarum TaxID=384 RepID=UPI003F97F370